jgi:hypothetical protein
MSYHRILAEPLRLPGVIRLTGLGAISDEMPSRTEWSVVVELDMLFA